MEKLSLPLLANALQSIANCIGQGRMNEAEKWETIIRDLCNKLPNGSEFDNGVKFDRVNSNSNELVFTFSFQRIEYTLSVRPSFVHSYEMRIKGKVKGNNKEYLHGLFSDVFTMKKDKQQTATPRK